MESLDKARVSLLRHGRRRRNPAVEPGDCEALFAKLDAVGTALKTAVDKLATSAETDATNLRTVVTGREHIEDDTKKKLDDAGNELTYV